MDYEKKYKEALERAKEMYKQDCDTCQSCLEQLFPELTESEEERIRKAIGYAIGQSTHSDGTLINGISSEKALTWLESKVKELVTCPICGWEIEKQADYTKFKIGDWVINTITNEVEQVIELTDCEYICSGHLIVSFNNQHLLKRWTIQDAKDGDVLVCEDFGYTSLMLFESFSNDRISLHCWHNSQTNNFHINTDVALRRDANIHPATKEQRNQLERAIADAGYKWDAEHKQLNKIEQKPAEWSEEDEKMLDFAIRAIGLCRQYAINNQVDGYSNLPDTPQKYRELQDWLKSLSPHKYVYLYECIKECDGFKVGKIYKSDGEWVYGDNKKRAYDERFFRSKKRWKPSDEQMKVLLSEVEGWTKGVMFIMFSKNN